MTEAPKSPLDLAHLQRIATILDALPGDTQLPKALIALEDAYACCYFALQCGISLEKAREVHREEITREETRRLLAEHRSSGRL